METVHNKKRYGEQWPEYRIVPVLEILNELRAYVILSGGWAWHFLSPEGHTEYKHAHDHKDVDIFVNPIDVPLVMRILQKQGFEKVWTRYDMMPGNEGFRRYEKTEMLFESKFFRVTIDFFERKEIPTRKVRGWNIVEPVYLLGLYGSIHSGEQCWAVQASKELLAQGIDPLDREELVTLPKYHPK